jgi:hypothetical protein
MKISHLKPLALLLTLSATIARADMIVSYDAANSPDGSPATSWMAGITPLQLTRGEGLNFSSGGTYNASNWNEEPTDYLQWGWSGGPLVSLQSLDLRYDRSPSGPSMIEILLSVNGGPFQNVFTDNDVLAAGEDALGIDLSAFTSVNSATFRLFGSGATSGSGTFDIESISGLNPARGIVVNGAAAVPEPSSFALLGIAATTAIGWRRLRR